MRDEIFYEEMTLAELILDNPYTIIFYTILFLTLAILLPFIGRLGKVFPQGTEKQNLILAKIYGFVAILGISFTVFVCFAFIFVRWRNLVNFELFAFVSFVIPVVIAPLFFASFYLTHKSDTENGKLKGRVIENRNMIELIVLYAFFAIVASNFHDILWCGIGTNWFQDTERLGYELKPWVDIVGAKTYSYVFFGFYMLLHVVFCGTMAVLLLWRYVRRYDENLLSNYYTKRAFLLVWMGSLLWGYGLYVMDSMGRHNEIWWLISTFIFIPLGIFILGYSGKYLSKFELSLKKKD